MLHLLLQTDGFILHPVTQEPNPLQTHPPFAMQAESLHAPLQPVHGVLKPCPVQSET